MSINYAKEFLNSLHTGVVFTELLMAASIPGVEIFSKKSACVVFFNMQNSNFMAAPESETFGLALTEAHQRLPSF